MSDGINYTDFDFSGSIVECHTCGGHLKGSLAKEVDESLDHAFWLATPMLYSLVLLVFAFSG